MDARTTFEAQGISRTPAAFVVATVAALLLGGAGGYVAKDLTVQSGVTFNAASAVTVPETPNGLDDYPPQRSGLQFGNDAGAGPATLGGTNYRAGGARS
jgi:polygalacturonase